ncbi:filaggrin-2-like isoform X1 [Hippocampus zosterae]|uniref:filaggrin-2-like isoform X1 n=1 Tax=Hippocampus zosterae TaxID=109293 RepID=UPI00223E0C8E|nr:filaggrin-2-like isoform X1 [Hippocampus zosterae]
MAESRKGHGSHTTLAFLLPRHPSRTPRWPCGPGGRATRSKRAHFECLSPTREEGHGRRSCCWRRRRRRRGRRRRRAVGGGWRANQLSLLLLRSGSKQEGWRQRKKAVSKPSAHKLAAGPGKEANGKHPGRPFAAALNPSGNPHGAGRGEPGPRQKLRGPQGWRQGSAQRAAGGGGARPQGPALRAERRQVQRPPRQRAGDLPLPDGHLHHPGGPQVALQHLHLRAGLHGDVALLRLHVVAHRVPARRPGPPRRQPLDSLRQQSQRLRVGLPVLHRDGNHHRLRLPGHYGQVPRGDPPAPDSVGAGLHRQRLHGGLHVRQDLATQEARRDAGVFHQRRRLHERRPPVPDVPGGRPAQLAHRGGLHPGQADQVQADQGGRVHRPQPDGHQRGLQHGRRPALPRLAAHHLPRDQPEQSLLGDLPGPPGQGGAGDCCHFGGHGRGHGHDVPGAQLVREQRDQVGLPLHARAHAGGRLLRGGLQQLPRHLRDQHARLQRPAAGRHERPRPPASHLVHGQQAEPAGPGPRGPAPRLADRAQRRRRQRRERVQSVALLLLVPVPVPHGHRTRALWPAVREKKKTRDGVSRSHPPPDPSLFFLFQSSHRDVFISSIFVHNRTCFGLLLVSRVCRVNIRR